MGWQPGTDGGTGTGPFPDPKLPSGAPPVRDPRLPAFASVDGRDALVPSGRLALLADQVSGPGRRCPGATDDELAGLLRAWAAVESWAAGSKLAVIRELMRRDDAPPNAGHHGDLPDEWSPSLRHEVALALACSVQSAETTAWLAWEQQARLPGIGALLGDGTLTLAKARAVIETFKYLSDADAAGAEALILGRLAGKTYPQVLRLAEQAALTVDPELAERRREQAQRKDARVVLFREQSGTAGLSGRDLPPDEALAAMASVNARAQQYEDSGAFGDTRMDVLRAYAYVDLLSGILPEARIGCARAQDEAAEAAEALAWAEARAARDAAGARGGAEPEAGPGAGATSPGAGTPGTAGAPDDGDAQADPRECPCGDCDGGCGNLAGDRDDDHGEPGDDEGEPGDGGPADGGPGGGDPGSGGGGPGPGPSPAGRALQLRPPDLIVPLATLLGLADRPGEIQGLGLLDPALARQLAAAAAASPRTEVCVTVTSAEGYAIGHGCARQDRSSRPGGAAASGGTSPAGLPARLNLTVPATALPGLADSTGLVGNAGPWTFAPRGRPGPPRDSTGPPGGPGPPGGYGTWALTLPGGRRLTVRLDPVPVFECFGHRYESPGYRPGGRLRHLVQVRDGTCTFPSCNRHARESDFEHAQPYDKGGRTCACNAGARSRACHRIKQSKNWNVTQPRPGWHQWTTPSGRVYVQEPWRYPA
ncbi:MAG: hypothetical protein ACRDOI_18570 [Trebonia sp.]